MRLVEFFSEWGLVTKAPEKIGVSNPVRVLGIRVNKDFSWQRDGLIGEIKDGPVTRRKLHSFVGETVSHFPVAGKVRLMCSMLQVIEIHNRAHFGIERTLELCKEKFGPQFKRSIVEDVVRNCERCSRYDPSVRFKWEKESIVTDEVWKIVATDVTHVNGVPFLTLIDIHSGFTIWRRMRNESANELIMCWSQIIAEYGPPEKILSDNSSIFKSRQMKELCQNWEIEQVFSAAYRPQGNGVVERVHRTIKRSVGRTKRSVEESVFW